ncbi:hypothetical protein DH2020_008786 [Rehmannia glutinosa]|uniref:R2R3-MYB protein n=1 Tax=Rehmannia glutinosa TaxID=99300 RepID=A0ABR0X4E1_REHGL
MGRGRAPCCDKTKVKKGPWSPAEDLCLTTFIQNHGHTNWRALPKQAGLLRCGKSCRLRWINYLRPDVKRGNFTPQEEQTIINLHNSIGNKWSKIASYFPGRTDNEIKNVWNTHLKKRLMSNKNEALLASPSCTSSSITSSGNHNMEKSLLNDDQGETQEPEIMNWIEKPEFPKLKSTHPNDQAKQAFSSDSPTSSYTSNETSEFSKSEVGIPDNGKIEIPLESDIDFGELFDSLDWNQDSNPEEKPDGGIECSKWFGFLENELGLTCDMDNLAKDQNIVPNLEPEFSPGLDYFPIWPCSPQNLGI